MSLLVAIVGLALLATPATVAASNLRPQVKLRIACTAIAAGLVALATGAALTASPLILWWHDGNDIGGLGLGHVSPGGPVAWAAAGLSAGVGFTVVASSSRRLLQVRTQAALPCWAAEEVRYELGVEVRVLAQQRTLAYAVPGRDPHIVLSRGLVNALGEAELRAVLAHEAAHIALSHHRYLILLSTYENLFSFLPTVSRSSAQLRVGVEQWADNIAIVKYGADRSALPRALRTAAMAAGADTTAATEVRETSLASGVVRSSWLQQAGLTSLLATLILAAAYLAGHSVADLNAALAALH